MSEPLGSAALGGLIGFAAYAIYWLYSLEKRLAEHKRAILSLQRQQIAENSRRIADNAVSLIEPSPEISDLCKRAIARAHERHEERVRDFERSSR